MLDKFQARIQKKNEPPQNFPVSRFYPIFPLFSQRFHDFLKTKMFKVCKCERRGSLDPREFNICHIFEMKHRKVLAIQCKEGSRDAA